MITNERQYKVTKAEMQKLEKTLKGLYQETDNSTNNSNTISKIQRDALQSQLETFNKQLKEYDALKSGEIKISSVSNFSDLPEVLIRARIAMGLTQADLAAKLDLKEQQIQRYESEKYYSASLRRLIEIADRLGVSIDGEANFTSSFDDDEDIWKSFPVNEMYKRGWFEGYTGSLKDAKNDSEDLLKDFFDYAGVSKEALCFHRKIVRSGSEINQFALKAWQARVLIKARKQKSLETFVDFRKREITEEWLSSLAKLSSHEDALNKISGYLAEKGIILIIEPHLQGTHLDGAALLLSRDSPVIALTLRQDRLDNFWFVLFHELAHVLLHLGKNDVSEIFDDELESDDFLKEIEREADDYALNKLLPHKIWATSIARFALTDKAVKKQAEMLGIHPAIVAGRLRKETGNYTLFNELIGKGCVRKFFRSEFYE